MLNGNDRLTPDSDGLRVVFRRPVQPIEVRNGLANPVAPTQGQSASGFEDTIPADAIRDALFRILGSAQFLQSDRLRRFLRFTVEAVLAGGGTILKEYLIGTEVYGRPSSYRPSEDSIVRSEARRLRSKLKEYYESAGKNDLIVIDYRPGSYIPAFRNRCQPGLGNPARDLSPRIRLRRRRGIRIAVLPFADTSCDGACCGPYGQLIAEELIHALVRTDGILVTAASSVAPLVARTLDVRTLARELGVQVVFEGSVRQDRNLLRITSRVVDPTDGFQVWSERTDTEPTLQCLPTVVAKIATSLVDHIGRGPLRTGTSAVNE